MGSADRPGNEPPGWTTPDPDDVVTLSVDDRVAVVTLNRPQQLNALTATMIERLSAAYRWCDAEDQVRAVVLTGAGRAFCAGADMTPAADTFKATETGFTASPVRPRAWEVRKPVIAAINGPAVGIGLTLAMQCDIRYVAADAKLAIPQVRRGVLGDAGSHWTVPKATSLAVAADLLLTGRTILGEEAARLGLVSRALPQPEVVPTALATAREIAVHCAPLSVALSKRLLWATHDAPTTEWFETAYHELLMGQPDAREGPAAWFERRPPRWTATVSHEWDRVLQAGAAAAPPGAGAQSGTGTQVDGGT